MFKYTILVENDNDCQKDNNNERTTRLLHLKWKLMKVRKIKPDLVAEDYMHKKQKIGAVLNEGMYMYMFIYMFVHMYESYCGCHM